MAKHQAVLAVVAGGVSGAMPEREQPPTISRGGRGPSKSAVRKAGARDQEVGISQR